jgi:hypothetical protein
MYGSTLSVRMILGFDDMPTIDPKDKQAPSAQSSIRTEFKTFQSTVMNSLSRRCWNINSGGKVKDCGLHDCGCQCYAISDKEAAKAIEAVKEACIEAVSAKLNNCARTAAEMGNNDGLLEAIQAIEGVK